MRGIRELKIKLIKEFYKYQIDLEFPKNNLFDLQNSPKRCNLIIDVVKETINERWEKYEKYLETLFKGELGIEENIIIERAHRTKSSQSFIIIRTELRSCKMQRN